MILNGSPRAPKSNSKRYAELFNSYCKSEINTFIITKNNHHELCSKMSLYTDVLLTFPLYADGLPVTLLDFLKSLEENPPENKPIIHVLINCGFIESEQNMVCIDMIRLFCKQNNYSFGSVLSIGSGEAILDTPFKFFVKRKIKALTRSIECGKPNSLSVAMPLPKKVFLNASTNFWINYGKKNGITKEQMDTMDYE